MFKSIEKYLNIEDGLVEENEEMVVDFNLFEKGWNHISCSKWVSAKNENHFHILCCLLIMKETILGIWFEKLFKLIGLFGLFYKWIATNVV